MGSGYRTYIAACLCALLFLGPRGYGESELLTNYLGGQLVNRGPAAGSISNTNIRNGQATMDLTDKLKEAQALAKQMRENALKGQQEAEDKEQQAKKEENQEEADDQKEKGSEQEDQAGAGDESDVGNGKGAQKLVDEPSSPTRGASQPPPSEPASAPAAEAPASEPSAPVAASEPAAQPSASEPVAQPTAEPVAAEPIATQPAAEPAAAEPAAAQPAEQAAAEPATAKPPEPTPAEPTTLGQAREQMWDAEQALQNLSEYTDPVTKQMAQVQAAEASDLLTQLRNEALQPGNLSPAAQEAFDSLAGAKMTEQAKAIVANEIADGIASGDPLVPKPAGSNPLAEIARANPEDIAAIAEASKIYSSSGGEILPGGRDANLFPRGSPEATSNNQAFMYVLRNYYFGTPTTP